MKIVLGGGGSAEQEASVLAHFASLVPRNGRVLYLPWAQRDPAEARLREWAERTLGTPGIGHVSTVSEISAGAVDLLESSDAIFIGGGNTYRLLDRLRETRLAAALVDAANAGFPCYGGSAGAIVLGASIRTCAHLDTNESGLLDLTGLNLCHRRAIWCHYADEATDRIPALIGETSMEILSMSENAGVRVGSEEMGSLGDGPVWRWSRNGRERVPSWGSG